MSSARPSNAAGADKAGGAKIGVVCLPGFGLPRDGGEPSRSRPRFANLYVDTDNGGIIGGVSAGVTLRERRMLEFIGTITEKPDWYTKVFNDAIVAKWRDEAKAMPPVVDGDVYMSEQMFDNCVAELRDKATRFADVGFVNVLDAELSVVKSDTAVHADVAAALRRCAAVLEHVPDRDKDWHPGTSKQVLDLVHPSLFPVVFGRTRALRHGTVPLDDCAAYIGKGELTTDEPDRHAEKGLDRYQWLPSDVVFAAQEDGRVAPTITSYVNNLHPQRYRELYGILEQFVAAAVPLWEECLSWWSDRRRQQIASTDDEFDFEVPAHIPRLPVPRRDGVGFHGDGQGDDPDSDGEPSDDEADEWQWSDEYRDWHEAHRVLKFREPDPFKPFAEQVNLEERVNLRDHDKFPQGLQVIFKLANIHLTPDNPSYAGGSWHIEGTMAERICASAIYYYDEANVTPSRLAFRQGINWRDMMMIPAQSAYTSLEKYFGVEQDGPAVQELGSVLTREGRLLAFPNVLQHRVGAFELQDPTRPGHRKILAMFLVDPHRRILSTANVPPQRKDWWASVVRQESPAFARLPLELFDQVIDLVDGTPMSWEDALEIRADLMKARSAQVDSQGEAMHEQTFNFCEH